MCSRLQSRFAVVGLLAVLIAALGSLSSSEATAREWIAGAAVSLRHPLERIARDFERQQGNRAVRLTFGASSTLAAQARAGAPLDVFISADPRWIDALAAEGWVEARRDTARNRLVVVAAPHFVLQQPEDLAGDSIRRIAVPAEAVPLGGYARRWLAERGLLARLRGRIVQTEHARATLAAVDAGHVDAAIVYVTDAATSTTPRSQLAIAAPAQPAIVYTAALRRGAGRDARAFFAFLDSPAARQHFDAAGFGRP